MKRTISQNNEFYALLAHLKLDDETKMSMVHNYSGGKTYKSSEMDRSEFQLMLNDLRYRSTFCEKSDKMRKKIISLFIKQGYTLLNNKCDMLALESWCEKYGYLHKPFNAYKKDELPRLVTQAENMYQSFLKTV